VLTWAAGLFTAAHSSEWISGLTGAGGAILGSLVTIVWTEWFNKRSAKRETRERLRVGALGAINRLNILYSDMMVVRDHLAEGFIKAHELNAEYLTLAVRPMNRLGENTRFTLEELRALTDIGGSRLLNAVNPLDRLHNVIADLMDMYRIDRTALWEQLPVKASDRGVAVFVLTEEQVEYFKPRLSELDEYLEKAHSFASDFVDDAYFALRLFIRARKIPFGRKFGISLTLPQGGLIKLKVPKRRWIGARLIFRARKMRRKIVCGFGRWKRSRQGV
jgi:hypothetical protein